MNQASIEAVSPALPAQSPSAPDWRVTGAAAIGVSHQRLGLPCQDAQGYRLMTDGTLLVALADGAGSAAFSDQGARCAVNEALDALSLAFEAAPVEHRGEEDFSWERLLLYEVFRAARSAVLRLAEENGAAPESYAREYACTLTCAIATSAGLVVGQVGDGSVVAATGEELFAVTRLQRGEYANETHFLTEEDALDQLVIDVVEKPVTGLAVMSDGLIRLALKLPTQEPHVPFFQPLFRFAAAVTDAGQAAGQLASFLNSARVNDRTDDDKSLVLAVRDGAPLPLAGRVAGISHDSGRVEERSSLDRERE